VSRKRAEFVRSAENDLGMAQNFIACDRDQELLLPPSLREWLPEDHLAWFVLESVGELIPRRVGWLYAAFRSWELALAAACAVAFVSTD
jgi:hypothetical protein